jgi:hypothetical protein
MIINFWLFYNLKNRGYSFCKKVRGECKMSIRCRVCRVELKDEDIVVLDDFNILRHKRCYDFEYYDHLVDSVGRLEDLQGKLPRFMIEVYKEVLAIGDPKNRLPEEIPDEEVYASLAYLGN